MGSKRNPILVWAVMPDDFLRGQFRNLKEPLQMYADRFNCLSKEGLDLRLIVPSQCSEALKFFSIGQVIREYCPTIALELSSDALSDEYAKALSWPRDIMQVFGDKIYSPAAQTIYASQMIAGLGMKCSNLKTEMIGEGGLSVGAGDVVIGAQPSGFHLNWDSLIQSGYRHYPFRLDVAKFVSEPGPVREKDKNFYNCHIDTELGLILTPRNDFLLFANLPFFRAYSEQIEYLARDIPAKLKVISSPYEVQRRAINLVQLPNRRVIVDGRCHLMRRTLEELMGKDYVIPIETFHLECSAAGGLRCRTNVFEFSRFQ